MKLFLYIRYRYRYIKQCCESGFAWIRIIFERWIRTDIGLRTRIRIRIKSIKSQILISINAMRIRITV